MTEEQAEYLVEFFNDADYQAKKIRENTEEVALSLMTSLGTDPAKIEATAKKLEAARAKYASDAEKIQGALLNDGGLSQHIESGDV